VGKQRLIYHIAGDFQAFRQQSCLNAPEYIRERMKHFARCAKYEARLRRMKHFAATPQNMKRRL
jgi:hypothetical protein